MLNVDRIESVAIGVTASGEALSRSGNWKFALHPGEETARQTTLERQAGPTAGGLSKPATGARPVWKETAEARRVRGTNFVIAAETGGMRRCTLHGRKNILKRLLIHVGAFNISLVMEEDVKPGSHGSWRTGWQSSF